MKLSTTYDTVGCIVCFGNSHLLTAQLRFTTCITNLNQTYTPQALFLVLFFLQRFRDAIDNHTLVYYHVIQCSVCSNADALLHLYITCVRHVSMISRLRLLYSKQPFYKRMSTSHDTHKVYRDYVNIHLIRPRLHHVDYWRYYTILQRSFPAIKHASVYMYNI